MAQRFQNFWKSRQSREVCPNFRNLLLENFRSIWFFSRSFRNFRSSGFNSFRIFPKLSKEISTPFAPISNALVFLVDGKRPTVTGFLLLRQAISWQKRREMSCWPQLLISLYKEQERQQHSRTKASKWVTNISVFPSLRTTDSLFFSPSQAGNMRRENSNNVIHLCTKKYI